MWVCSSKYIHIQTFMMAPKGYTWNPKNPKNPNFPDVRQRDRESGDGSAEARGAAERGSRVEAGDIAAQQLRRP